MKNYMPLDGLRCSRDSGSAHCDTPKSAVLGRPGGVIYRTFLQLTEGIQMVIIELE